MLENQVEETYNPKKDELNLNHKEKESFFKYVYKSMITDRVVTALTGIAAVVTGSSIPTIQQNDPSLVSAYILGTLAFAGSSVYSGISAVKKRKQLKIIDKEIDEIENNPGFNSFA